MPASDPAPSALPDAEPGRLAAARCELELRCWSARIVRYRLCNENDVRLQVAGDRRIRVEILGSFGARLCGDCWQAVRIAADSRVVWSGPTRRSLAEADLTALVHFVDDLLRRDIGDLTSRYARLG